MSSNLLNEAHVNQHVMHPEPLIMLLQKAEKEAAAAAKAAEEGKPSGGEQAKAPATAQVGLCLWQMLLGMVVKVDVDKTQHYTCP